MKQNSPQLFLTLMVAIGVGLTPAPVIGSAAIGGAQVIALAGDSTPCCGPINFFIAPAALSCDSTVLTPAVVGTTPDIVPVLLAGQSRPLVSLAAGGDVIDGGAEIQGFNDVLFGAHGWVRFTSSNGGGLAAIDPPGSPFIPVAGAGAVGPAAAISPRELASSGEWIAILEQNPSFELVKLTAIAPFEDPNQVVEILEVGETVAGVPITEFVFNSLSLNPSGVGLVRAQRNGLDETVVQFSAPTGDIIQKFAVGDQAPGFPTGVEIVSVRSAATLNAVGYYAVKVRIFGPGIAGTDEVLYLFSPQDDVVGFIQEDTQIPGAPSGQVFTFISTPFVGPTGAVFLYQHLLDDESRLRALGMIDLQGGFHTIGVAGTPAPGGGTFGQFSAAFAINRLGLLVFQAEVEGVGATYFGLDTAVPGAQAYRIIGPDDEVTDAGGATVLSLGMIAQSGGEDGRSTSLNETQFIVSARLSTDENALLLVNAVEVAVPPTATPTETPTVTTTSTPSASPTGSPTDTTTPTSTFTPTHTTTATAAPSPSFTNTPPDVPPLTPTPVATSSPTSTPTRTPTQTPTPDFLDFGDAPDDIELPGRPTPRYPTLRESNGARHRIVEGFFLGQAIDAEIDGQPNESATGDDESSAPDDEDGVTFVAPLEAGEAVPVSVIASLPGRLDLWVDFNGDGDWADQGEQLLDVDGESFRLLQGLTEIPVPVPADAVVGPTFARFRYSSNGGLPVDGLAENGEVEDYRVVVEPSRRGDGNCDGRVTAADVPAVARGIATGVAAPCGLDDVDNDGDVDRDDLEVLLQRIFLF